MISISGLAQAASGPQAAGQIMPSPRALAPIAAGSTPATGAIVPSSAEFAQHRVTRERVMRDGADRGHQAERDRQIVVAAFLRHIGRSEIDGDSPRRQGEARGDQRARTRSRASADRLVGQADDVKAGSPARSAPGHRPRAPRCPRMPPLKRAGPSCSPVAVNLTD